MGVDCRGSVTSILQIVSATDASVKPAMQIISPAVTVFTGILSAPRKVNNFVRRPVSI